MQLSFHRAITVIAVAVGSLALLSGIAGTHILLYLCGITAIVAVHLPERKVEIFIDIRKLKFRLRLIPSAENRDHSQLDEGSLKELSEKPENQESSR